jgi:hypothetical protein
MVFSVSFNKEKSMSNPQVKPSSTTTKNNGEETVQQPREGVREWILNKNPFAMQIIKTEKLLSALKNHGFEYEPDFMMKNFLIEGVFTYIGDVMAQEGRTFENSPEAVKVVNAVFEEALVESNLMMAIQSGFISQNRASEIISVLYKYNVNPMMGMMGEVVLVE